MTTFERIRSGAGRRFAGEVALFTAVSLLFVVG